MDTLYRVVCFLLVLAISASSAASVQQLPPNDHLITLHTPVELSADDLAYVRSIPTLQVSAYRHIPPMSFFDQATGQYQGISIDVFRFIADHIGLPYEFYEEGGLYVDKKIEEFGLGQYDVLIPASYVASRDGLFTETYYEGFYSVISRKSDQLQIQDIQQLKQYRVGMIKNAAVVPYAQDLVGEVQVFEFVDGILYEALRKNKIDIAIFNQSVFEQDRYRFELFDLEDAYTLDEYPRNYGFLFKNSEQNQRLIDIFNRYIKAMNNQQSIRKHENAEQYLIEKYIKQKGQQQLLWIAVVISSLMSVVLFVIFRSRQHMLKQLAESHQRISQQREALQEANVQLESLSRTDVLTGMPNRRHLDERLALAYEWYKRKGDPLSVLIIDIDFFKLINDDYGHATGDLYLKKVAGVLTQIVGRSTDFCARYGGEEFVCVLPNTDTLGAVVVAEQIREAVFALHDSHADVLPRILTISIGVATLQSGRCDHHALVKQADVQLYRAKNSGRNRVCAIVLEGSAQSSDTKAQEQQPCDFA
ncbi:MAG TPA: GGDEF domain-containing protein [Thiopseudomonas sp.]|nr:GGDEF domain-containing protein [Thiopseudomonas sp.]